MAKAPAGMTGGLSITDMRELMKATDEIEALAEHTANQLKALTDRSDECRRLVESPRRCCAHRSFSNGTVAGLRES